jgi:hypothetical protein
VATVRPLGDIQDKAFALVDSLDDTQKGAAVLPGDVWVAGYGVQSHVLSAYNRVRG